MAAYTGGMPAKEISLENADQGKLFYFVANVVVYRPGDGRCLVLKRDESEKVHPGKWAVPGGKLEWADFDLAHPTRRNGDVLDFENAIEQLLAREVKEEAGIEIHPELQFVNDVFFVRPDGIPVVLVKFAAKYKKGEVVPEKGAFTDHKWVNEQEIAELDCIQGISEEVAKTITLFSQKK
jgi:8-oxo-dGTP pyrophosphatase MutT (NUDIX family)